MAISYSDVIKNQAELQYVAPQYFYMVVHEAPKIAFNCQQLQVPTISSGEVDLPNNVNPTRMFIAGDGVDYATVDVTFLLDKQFDNYRSILNWIKGINNPDAHEQYSDYVNTDNNLTSLGGFAKTMSDITVFASDAGNDPICQWTFKNCFPISLDGPLFDATAPDIEYLTSNVSFRYHYFEHSVFNNGSKGDII